MNRRTFLKVSAAAAAAGWAGCALTRGAPRLPEATWQKLPRWRGFNLLEKFNVSRNAPFVETDFQWLSDWGFNFVRLPMDYRCWAKTPEAEFHEPTLREIDQAIEWGRRYHVHVCLNFHRAPGYTVARPPEARNLWKDPGIQEQFARHWAVFAKRYQGIPSRHLSFNLLNEPSDITGAEYAAAVKPAVDAIRAADPQRLIIADGIRWGTKPVPELIPLGVAQSTRGYEPGLLSHYKASWINHSGPWATPTWPVPVGINAYLYGDSKADLKSPLVLHVNCPQTTTFGIRVGKVSAQAELLVKADGAIVLQKLLQPGPGSGEWKKSEKTQWGSYNAEYDREYTATIPAGTRQILVEVGKGDWMTFWHLRLNELVIVPGTSDWGVKQEAFIVDNRGARPVNLRYRYSKETLWKTMIEPWQQLATQGVGVHVGEWGSYNQTPHDVVLAWMRDCLDNWKKAGFGWALWNFRGSFGILDSERQDVVYEDYKGHKLDRKMLELLRAF